MKTNATVPPRFPPKLTLIIGNKNYSSWSLCPWLAMAAKGVPFAEILVPLGHANSKQQLQQYSPTGLVPALKYGNLVLWESLSIIEFVNEKHPEAKLWPEDIEIRAIARSLAMEMHAGFRAVRQQLPMNLKRQASRRLNSAAEAELMRFSDYVRHLRMEHGAGGPFLFGEFSAVDAMFAPLCTRIRTYEVPVDRMAQDYVDAIYHLPAFQKWYQAAIAEPWKMDDVDNIDQLRSTR
ncbi:MAG: glutathione S-transferase family protein [Beijerinckiaceae bacterium]|nr:glutathione S-transferase family protein [Beijerinckiaceae bacterium]